MVSLYCPLSFSQIIENKGVIVVYYTKNVLPFDEAPEMFCMDSIRLYINEHSFPVEGHICQNEFFLYQPIENVSEFGYILEQSKYFSINNGKDLHIHKGGDIYEKIQNSNCLYISFNIKGCFYKVIPDKNSFKNDTVIENRLKAYKQVIENEKYKICTYTFNENTYLVLLDKFSTYPLTRKQIKKLGFIKSKKTQFFNYGVM